MTENLKRPNTIDFCKNSTFIIGHFKVGAFAVVAMY